METLQETINLRLQLRKVFKGASTATMKNASKVKVEIAMFDPEKNTLKGMLHTAISGKEIYQSRIELKDNSTHCTCVAGKRKQVCIGRQMQLA